MKRHHRKPSKIKSSSGELFFKPKVQTKLTMGQSGDAYEVEADKMADAVVNSTEANTPLQKKASAEEEIQQKPLAAGVTPWVQKKAKTEEEPVQKMDEEEPVQSMEEEEPVQSQEERMTEEDKEAVRGMQEGGGIPIQHKMEEEPLQKAEEEEPIQSMEEEEESVQQRAEEEPVQPKADNSKTGSQNIESRLKKKNSGGSQMDADTLHEMEGSFGADFSEVNIHTDTESEQMSQDIGAQAFTQGHDIYFNKGKYDPKSKKGKHLLAHELTHTLQQKGVVQKKVQRKPTFVASDPIQDIDMFNPATAPGGDTAAIGNTTLYVNGQNVSTYRQEHGPEATANLLFPLPEYQKIDGECHLTNKDLKVDAYSKIRILTPGPWVKEVSKEEMGNMLGGILKDELNQLSGDSAILSIEGDPNAAQLFRDDIKAEMQHVAADQCLFNTYLKKYQEDVNALPDRIPANYYGFGSCEAKLEQLLGRIDRYNGFVSENKKFVRWYDHEGGPHSLVPDIQVSEDGTQIRVKLKFKDLGQERPCDQ